MATYVPNSYTVYAHTNKVNGMKYIGCTGVIPEKRWSNGRGYSNGQEKFYSAINEYGWNNFDHEIIESGLSKEEALKLEEELIQKYDTVLNGYNSAYGGEQNRWSEASRMKLREQRLGEKNPKFNPNIDRTSRKKISRIESIVETEEEKETRLAKQRENYRNSKLGSKNPNYGKHTWCYGIKMTEKQKENMYKAWTDERRELVRNQKLGSKNPQAKKVLCVTTGVIYDTIVEAAKMNGVSERTVSRCCNGGAKYPRIKFEFVKEGD